ncbi:MAG: prenyltransferase/squalene oxidase repeat-containing protein [Anaerolineae bacterium]
MNRRKLGLSIALGVMLTIGLLVGFSLSHDSAMASTEAREVIDQTSPREAIRAQDTVSTAHVVVQFGDNDAIVRPITFTEPISGLTALQLIGLNVAISNTALGPAVCAIGGVGCPADDCFCGGFTFWNYLYWAEDSWAGYGVGVGGSTVEDGDVEGYAWGAWGTAPPPAPSLLAAQKGLKWLRDQQLADGGFGSANNTAEVLMAVGANGIDASTWRHSPSLLANMLSNATEFANRNAAGVGKLAIALAAQESCWPIGAQRPISYYDPMSGTFDNDTLYQAWGILGTVALSETVPVSAVEALKDNQLPNGGWEWAVDAGADTNNTALALQAMIAAGEPVTSTSIVSGLTYLENAQNDDGGFPWSPDSPWGTDSDANSTAYVVQALFAAGEDPLAGTWTVTNSDPISYLLSMQLLDGSFEWQEGSGANASATRQVIPGLLHQPFPLETTVAQDCYGISGNVSKDEQTVQGRDDGIADVTVWAQGASDLYFGTTISPTGAYTISASSTGPYTLSPSYGDYVFSPAERTVQVRGAPGDVTVVEPFAGRLAVYIPLVMRR